MHTIPARTSSARRLWSGSIISELEPEEADLLAVPVGSLDRKRAIEATWESEGMAVLAWALQRAELPAIHVECDPGAVAIALGFLDDRQTPLESPILRDARNRALQRYLPDRTLAHPNFFIDH